MKSRVLSLAAVSVLLLNSLAFGWVNTPSLTEVKKRAASKIVSALPESDGIALIDSKRFLDDALPKVLSANQPMLAEVMSKVKAMETRTGIDLRKFSQLAVGVAMKQVSPTEVDYDAVAIGSGDVSSESVIASARAAAKGPVREEKLASRTIYIFSGKEIAAQPSGAQGTSKVGAAVDKLIMGLGKKEIAVAAFDPNTIVIGSPERVRQTLGSKTKVDPEVSSLLPAKDTAVVTFAARTNGMLGKMLPLDADMLGDNLSSIQYVTGFMDVAAGTTSVQLTARTKKPEQASDLKTTLEGLQLVGKAFLGGSKRADQQVYGRMLQNAKFSSRSNEVVLDLAIPQSDIDVLIGGLK